MCDGVSDPIVSERLELIPISADFLRAALADQREVMASLLETSIPDAWPIERPLLELRLAQLERDVALEPWLLRAMRTRRDPRWVGHIGFHSRPGPDYLDTLSPGGVELGFTVFSPFRRRGYAREACLAMMEWARTRHGVTRFVVSISPDNLASRALAHGLGFSRIGSHVDEVDGPEDIFERVASARDRAAS